MLKFQLYISKNNLEGLEYLIWTFTVYRHNHKTDLYTDELKKCNAHFGE